ncbi:MAG TPA: hypothetical protein VMU30_12100, partial [Bacteroidota bacterium]|nr:hypothetical protein [Bacteroidota bacterium]
PFVRHRRFSSSNEERINGKRVFCLIIKDCNHQSKSFSDVFLLIFNFFSASKNKYAKNSNRRSFMRLSSSNLKTPTAACRNGNTKQSVTHENSKSIKNK